MSEENKPQQKEIYYMPQTFALSQLLEQGYTRRQADDICWWALSEEFQQECEKRGTDVADASEEKRVRLYLKMYNPIPAGEVGKISTSKPLPSAGMENFIVVLLFIVTFASTLWLFL